MVRIERNPLGPRVYVLGLRVHHGLTGCALILIGLARSEQHLVGLGIALVLDDRHDFPWSPRERANHELPAASPRFDYL